MRRSRFTEAQIVGILKEHESATFRHQEWVRLSSCMDQRMGAG
jgi:hypothetical protein